MMRLVEGSVTLSRVLDLSALSELLHCCKRTIVRRVEARQFPAPAFFVGKRPRWQESDVVAWIEEQKVRRGRR